MTSGPPDLSIASFGDVLDQGYDVVVLESSANQDYLRFASSGSDMQKVYADRIDGNSDAFVGSNEEGKQKILGMTKALYFGSVLSILGDDRYLALQITDGVEGSVAWALQKNSELTACLNYHLSQLDESGILFKMRRRWTWRASEEFGIAEAEPLDYENIMFPFCVLVISAAVALILAIAERIKRSCLDRNYKAT